MEAKDLMIGDWVCIDEPDKYAGATGQIQSLMNHREDDAAYFNIFIQGKFGYVSRDVCSDDIRPIPLTPEILEKNFPIANGCEYRDDNNGICIEIYFNAKTEKYKKYAILYTDKGKIYIDKYVHQLQHALRLCEIEKEIIL